MGKPNGPVAFDRDFLAHYGVKGMKWGVIRDNIKSNPRGALKTAKRVAGVASDIRRTGVKNKADYKEYTKPAEDHVQAQNIRLKQRVAGAHTLSNRELQTVITRMNLEVQFKNLKQAEFESSYVGKGKQFAANFVTDVAKDVAASWLKRPGSNFTGRTSARAGAFVGRTIEGAVTQRRAIGM